MTELHFKSKELEVMLEPVCLRVLERFQLPARRLLCFFDDADPPCFAQRFGGRYRGFHLRVIGSGYVPPYIQRLFFDSLGGIAFDNLIYLPGRTCAIEAGAVITFAHELEHFVQYATLYKVWVANTILYQYLPSFEPTTTAKAWNIPHEQDAMIVSKRVAETVIGTDAVCAHVAARIAAKDDESYWRYFRGLSSQASFDLVAETIPWVDKYRTHLLRIQQSDVDFSEDKWWS
jgi:hypothetical protein